MEAVKFNAFEKCDQLLKIVNDLRDVKKENNQLKNEIQRMESKTLLLEKDKKALSLELEVLQK
jgi:uncharacterized protein YlxW (UPF0749 family)